MKKIYSYILSIFVLFPLFFVFSCSDLAETSESEQNTQTIVYDSTLNGRGLINLKLANNTSSRFATTKIEVNSYRFKINGAVSTPIQINSSTETVYTFTLAPETYTFLVEGLDTTSRVVASGSKSIKVAANGRITDTITIEAGVSTETTGNVNLEISCSVSDITKLQVVGLTSSAITYTKNSDNKFIINETNISAGLHTVDLSFIDNNETVITTIKEDINVIAGLTANTWVKNGTENWLNAETFTITDSILQEIANEQVFVKEGSTGLKNGTWASPYSTLQDAINKVQTINNGSSQYTIFVDGTLNNAYGEIAPSSNLKLKITSRTTDKATLNGSTSKSQILKIQSRANVTLDNLILDGQSRNSASIQGIQTSSGSTLTVNNCTIRYCSTSENGGGINNSGDVTISESTIQDCSTTINNGGGGGIYSSNKLKIENSTIKNCKSMNNNGGGIFIDSTIEDALVIENSNIGDISKSQAATKESYSNYAKNNGGAIYVKTGSINIDSTSKVYFNSAEGSGGGIYLTGTGSTIIDGNIFYNGSYTTSNSGGGGGLYIQRTDSNTPNITGNFSGNYTTKNGGGIRAISKVKISGIIGSYQYTSTTASMNENDIATETKNSNRANNGGGISCQEATEITGVVAYNYATNGGGIKNSAGQITLNGATLKNNFASTSGSAVNFINTLNLSGEVAISNNDIFVSNSTIEITGTLNTKKRIKITLNDYTSITEDIGHKILTGDYSTNYNKFKSSNLDYYIKNDGNMYKGCPVSNLETTDLDGTAMNVIANDSEDIKNLKTLLDAGKTFENVTIELKDNLTINHADWQTKVGDRIKSLATGTFKGTFEGNGKTLTFNIYGVSNNQDVSFIETNEGIIRDLITSYGTLTIGSNTAGKDGCDFGGICKINKGLVINCGTKETTIEAATIGHIGGICIENNGKIINCINKADLTNSSTRNLIWAGNYQEIGGITAFNSGTIENCVNTGTIKTTVDIYDTTAGIQNIPGAITGVLQGGIVNNSYWRQNCVNQSSNTDQNYLVYKVNNYSSCIPSGTISNCGYFSSTIFNSPTTASRDLCGGLSNSNTITGTYVTDRLNNYNNSKIGVYSYNGSSIPLKNWDSNGLIFY